MVDWDDDEYGDGFDDEFLALKKDYIDQYGRSIYKIKGKSDNIQLFIAFFCGEDNKCTFFNEYMKLFGRK